MQVMVKQAVRALALAGAVCTAVVCARAETVDSLPKQPAGYVTDTAGVLSAEAVGKINGLCSEVDQQAKAQIAVAVVKTTEGEPIEEFANHLFAKWGVGPKGTDRGVLLVFAVQDRKRWIEVGYGLEGALNDAKAGDIGRAMIPDLRAGDYDGAVELGVGQIAQVVAQDAGVTLQSVPAEMQGEMLNVQLTPAQRLMGAIGGLLVLGVLMFALSHAGPNGLIWMLLGMALSGGGRGGFGDGEGGFGGGGGGGFGGFGGGMSGGGGAGGGW